MSWQPGDVSPDARRAAEMAAEAAGVPLKDWFAQTVRAAIVRELGRIPGEEPGPTAPSELVPEPSDPPAALPEPLGPIVAAEPLDPEPIAAAEPPMPIAEPATLTAEPIAVAIPEEPTRFVAPEVPAPVSDASAMADRRARRISVQAQTLSDRSFSSWLASRIEGLPARTAETSPSAPPRRRPPEPTPVSSTVLPKEAQHEAAPPLSLPSGPVTTLPLTSLRPARIRARRFSDADPAIPALAASVATQGVREPVLVRRLAETADEYEVVVGERRRIAAARADRADLPAIIVEAGDAEALLLSLTENLGRGDFSPLDEARAYLRLLTEHRVSPGALAQRLGRDRSHVALALRLLGLPPRVRQVIDSGRLAPAQAFALLGASDPDAMAQQMMEANGGQAPRDSA